MQSILTNTWLITIAGGVLASLVAASVLNWRPSIPKLYQKALRRLCKEATISHRDRLILRNALKSPATEEILRSAATSPEREVLQLCRTIANLAPSYSALANSAQVATLVGRLLEIEFAIEGVPRYRISHERIRDRQPYFEQPPAPTNLRALCYPQRVVLTWSGPGQKYSISSYHIARRADEDGPYAQIGTVKAQPSNEYSFTDRGLDNGTMYYYTVTAETRTLKSGVSAGPISAMPVEASVTLAPGEDRPLQTQVLPTTFFSRLESLQGISNNCLGRERELVGLQLDIMNRDRHLFIIEGFGGIGKTTLAARLTREISPHYHVLWVNCKDTIVTAERILLEVGHFAAREYSYPWLSAIVESPSLSEEEKINGLLDFLASIDRPANPLLNHQALRPIVLFFDDYHLVKDPALDRLIDKMVAFSSVIKVVLVIRNRVNLASKLQTKVDASNLQLAGLSLADCREYVKVHAAKFPALAQMDEEMVELLWQRTGQGVPSALEILLWMTRKRSLRDILDRLPTYDPLLAAIRKEWFDALFDELSPEERQVAAEVSIFRRPTSLEALKHVCSAANADEVIDGLVDRFVLTFDGNGYSMHTLWAEYLRQTLSDSRAEELHRRAGKFYRAFRSDDRYTEVMSRLESSYHYIRANDVEQAVKVLTPIAPIADVLRSESLYWELTDILAEIEKTHAEEDEVGKNRAENNPLDMQRQIGQSAILYARGEVEQSVAILKELVGKSSGEVQNNALQELAWIYIETGKRREAEQILEQSRQQAHQNNLPGLEAEALFKLQRIAYYESNYDKALAYIQERLRILEALKYDPDVEEAIAWTRHEIGNVYRERGYYQEALELYQQDLPFWRKRGNPPNRVGWIPYDIGQIYRDQGKLKEAQEQFNEALKIFESMPHIYGIAHVKIELGRIGAKLMSFDRAISQVQEAIVLLRKMKGVSGEAYALGALGQIYLSIDKPVFALEYLQQNLQQETELGNLKGRAWSLHQISLAYAQQGRQLLQSEKIAEACRCFCEAVATIAQAEKLYTQIGVIPNFLGIQDAIKRLKLESAECECSA